jgi:hypothetical protein
MTAQPLPLEGMFVLDFSQFLAGPMGRLAGGGDVGDLPAT